MMEIIRTYKEEDQKIIDKAMNLIKDYDEAAINKMQCKTTSGSAIVMMEHEQLDSFLNDPFRKFLVDQVIHIQSVLIPTTTILMDKEEFIQSRYGKDLVDTHLLEQK